MAAFRPLVTALSSFLCRFWKHEAERTAGAEAARAEAEVEAREEEEMEEEEALDSARDEINTEEIQHLKAMVRVHSVIGPGNPPLTTIAERTLSSAVQPSSPRAGSLASSRSEATDAQATARSARTSTTSAQSATSEPGALGPQKKPLAPMALFASRRGAISVPLNPTGKDGGGEKRGATKTVKLSADAILMPMGELAEAARLARQTRATGSAATAIEGTVSGGGGGGGGGGLGRHISFSDVLAVKQARQMISATFL